MRILVREEESPIKNKEVSKELIEFIENERIEQK